MADRSTSVNEITQSATPPLPGMTGTGDAPWDNATTDAASQPGPGRSNPPQPKGNTTGYP